MFHILKHSLTAGIFRSRAVVLYSMYIKYSA